MGPDKVRHSAGLYGWVILVNAALLELLLVVLGRVSPPVNELLGSPWASAAVALAIPDERLGHRPNPALPTHDRLGFRNRDVPEKADVVALGDSQTYGAGVDANEAWPFQLQLVSGRKVYSMAYGGYGPVHSLILWDEADALRPDVVIEAVYAGNDLFDSFDLVYNRGQLPGLKSTDARIAEEVVTREQREPIEQRVSRMFQMGTTAEAVARKPEPSSGDGKSILGFLSAYSKTYGLLRRVLYTVRGAGARMNAGKNGEWEAAKTFAEAHSEYCEVFDDGQFRTIFTSEYRLSALDLDDPRIAEGLQISLRAIEAMHQRALARNIRFIVMLIPTKEMVFGPYWHNPLPSFHRLLENEERFRTIARDYFRGARIEYLDALPVLQGQLAAGVQPFFVTHDGHLNPRAHRAVAQMVATRLATK